MNQPLRAAHFTATDHELVLMAGHHLLAWITDIAYHEATDHGWWPCLTDDPAQTAQHVAELLRQAKDTLREVRRLLNEARRPAQARALAEANHRHQR